MFIGHFAVGFAAKKFAPRSSEAVLLTAALLADLLWPFFLLLGWEQVRIDPGNTRYTPLDLVYYPWSHSLLMLCVWATAFGGIYYAITRYWPGAIAIWIGVVSHWVLDWVTHRPDMPLYPGGARYGLGLWNSIAGHDGGGDSDVRGGRVDVCECDAGERPHRALCAGRVRGVADGGLHRRSIQPAAR
jgi:hypothetical protein